MTPKATTNGTIGAIPESCWSLTARYDCVATTAPGGSARPSAAASALSAAAEPAELNRYSIWAVAGVPGARSTAISLGRTQPSADWLSGHHGTARAAPDPPAHGVLGGVLRHHPHQPVHQYRHHHRRRARRVLGGGAQPVPWRGADQRAAGRTRDHGEVPGHHPAAARQVRRPVRAGPGGAGRQRGAGVAAPGPRLPRPPAARPPPPPP